MKNLTLLLLATALLISCTTNNSNNEKSSDEFNNSPIEEKTEIQSAIITEEIKYQTEGITMNGFLRNLRALKIALRGF